MAKKKKQKLFTLAHAKRLADILEAEGWTVYAEDQEAKCAKCNERQKIEWDYCPACGHNHSEDPAVVSDFERRQTLLFLRETLNELLS
jgi:Zn finger protein HypA/HybF involved in hydrogenase expression